MSNLNNSKRDINIAKSIISIPNILNNQDVVIDSKGFRMRTCFINRTQDDVTVVLRNGLRFTIPKTTSNSSFYSIYKYDFIVRETYEIDIDIISDVRNYFQTITDLDLPDEVFIKVKEDFEEKLKIPNIRQIQIHIDYVIEKEMLNSTDNLYLANKDILISRLNINDAGFHPYSNLSLLLDGIDSLSEKHRKDVDIGNGFGLNIEVIDNDSLLLDRFIKIGDQIYRIKPKKSLIKDSGVYLVIIDKNSQNTLSHKYYTHEESMKILGLYKTKEQCLAHNDNISLERQKEIEELKHEAVVLQLELKKKILEAEEKKAKLDSKLEEVRYERNIAAELFKFIPILVSAGLAIYVAVNKGGSSK